MPKRRQSPKRPRLDHVVVEGDIRDEIDWDRFAWALFQYARILVEQEDSKDKAP
jgi:hypothetical protein